jgi:hypothetical protein
MMCLQLLLLMLLVLVLLVVLLLLVLLLLPRWVVMQPRCWILPWRLQHGVTVAAHAAAAVVGAVPAVQHPAAAHAALKLWPTQWPAPAAPAVEA